MISKSELLHMLWGITRADDYWCERNIQIISSGEKIVSDSEQEFARKIGMTFNQIKSELIKLQELNSHDVPAIVLGDAIPESLRNTRIHDLIERCRQSAQHISNT